MLFLRKNILKERGIQMNCRARITIMYAFVLLMFVFLICRLYTVSESTAASEVLSGQYSRKIEVASRRGFIFDRNGNLLNCEKNGYVCVVDPSKCDDIKQCVVELSEISDIRESEIAEKFFASKPFIIKTVKQIQLQGIYFYPNYIYTTACAPHIVGYINSDGNGVSGIEKSFNECLSNVFSGKLNYIYKADALGKNMKGIGTCLYDDGYTQNSGVYLTLDKDLQLFCAETAKKYIGSGAVCVADVHTGEILASLSLPEFETNDIGSYLESDNGEFINRCAASFTPGSIFKTVVAAAALEVDSSFHTLEYECCGKIAIGENESLSCHNKDGHGKITMNEAYAQSCNPYFVNLAFNVGWEKIVETAEKMGICDEKIIDGILAYKSSVPRFSQNTASEKGYIANLAIGQGETLLAPYSVINVFSCAATGYLTEPHILFRIRNGDCNLKQFKIKRERVLKQETVNKLREMMGCCIENGLGIEAKPKNGKAGGKTATAQTGRYKNESELLNYWFCGVYPLDAPQYAVCVLGEGENLSANVKNVFKEICDYLSERESPKIMFPSVTSFYKRFLQQRLQREE